MSQEVRNFNKPDAVLIQSQIAALKSLSLLLVREIDSLGERQSALENEIENKEPISLHAETQRFEIKMIRCALIRTGGKQNEAAKLLGIKPTTFYEKAKRYNINLNGLPAEARTELETVEG